MKMDINHLKLIYFTFMDEFTQWFNYLIQFIDEIHPCRWIKIKWIKLLALSLEANPLLIVTFTQSKPWCDVVEFQGS
jgi:hypothetical protein